MTIGIMRVYCRCLPNQRTCTTGTWPRRRQRRPRPSQDSLEAPLRTVRGRRKPQRRVCRLCATLRGPMFVGYAMGQGTRLATQLVSPWQHGTLPAVGHAPCTGIRVQVEPWLGWVLPGSVCAITPTLWCGSIGIGALSPSITCHWIDRHIIGLSNRPAPRLRRRRP